MEDIKCKDCDEIYDPSSPHFCSDNKTKFQKDLEKKIDEDKEKQLKIENENFVADEKDDKCAIASICLGVASVLFWEFSIIPVLAIIFGIIGLFRYERKWLSGIGLILGVIFLLVKISQGPNDGIFSPRPLTEKPLIETPTIAQPLFTNPDYLKNPSDYLIDEKNQFYSDSSEYILWVEEVVNSNTFKVSYVIERAGQKILEVKNLSIMWLRDQIKDSSDVRGYPGFAYRESSMGKCWEKGAKEYLEKNFLHTKIIEIKKNSYYDFKLPRLYGFDNFGKPTIDIVYLAIQSGYGQIGKQNSNIWLNQLSERERLNISPSSPTYWSVLNDMEVIASLSKQGLWGECYK